MRKDICNFKILFLGHLNLRIYLAKQVDLIMISLLIDEDEQLSH